MNAPRIVAHRGLSCLWPENSMIAYRKAVELGADGIECDVRLTSDDHLIMMHDATIDRTTTGKGFVRNLTLARIQQCKFKDPRDPELIVEGPIVPTFDEFLDFMKTNDLELRIELKEVGYEEKVVRRIKAHGLAERVMLTSFQPDALRTIKEYDRSIKTVLITSDFYQVRYERIKPYIDGVDFQFIPEIIESLYAQARSDGMVLDLWIVDDAETYRRILPWQPDAITSNFPQRVMEEAGRPVPDWARLG